MTRPVGPSFEEAKRCPKCDLPGDDRIQRRGPNGSTLHQIYCVSKLCRWYDTCWTVQVNRDGTIPPPQDHTHSPKVYQGFDDHDALAKQITEALEVQRELETRGDGEIRNPNSNR